MTVVVDVNLVVALVLPLPYSFEATELARVWKHDQQRIIAPALLEYELTTVVRRGVATGQLKKARAVPVLQQLLQSGVELAPPTPMLHEQALRWAEVLGQHKAYDAQYLALAARENAPLWTADRRLAHAARGAGLDWVNWIGDWNAEV